MVNLIKPDLPDPVGSAVFQVKMFKIIKFLVVKFFCPIKGQKPDFCDRMNQKTGFFLSLVLHLGPISFISLFDLRKKNFLKVQEGSKFPYFFPFLEAVGSSSYHLLPSLAVTWVTTDTV